MSEPTPEQIKLVVHLRESMLRNGYPAEAEALRALLRERDELREEAGQADKWRDRYTAVSVAMGDREPAAGWKSTHDLPGRVKVQREALAEAQREIERLRALDGASERCCGMCDTKDVEARVAELEAQLQAEARQRVGKGEQLAAAHEEANLLRPQVGDLKAEVAELEAQLQAERDRGLRSPVVCGDCGAELDVTLMRAFTVGDEVAASAVVLTRGQLAAEIEARKRAEAKLKHIQEGFAESIEAREGKTDGR